MRAATSNRIVTVLLSAAAVLAAVAVGAFGPSVLGALSPGARASGPDAAAASAGGGSSSPPPTVPGPSLSDASRPLPNIPALEPDEAGESGQPGGQAQDPAGADPDESAATGPPQSQPQPAPEPQPQPPPAPAPEPQPQPQSQPAPESQPAPQPQPLQVGDQGPRVTRLQHRLQDLGYWLGGANGTYDHLTRQAVIAFQGVEGLARDGVVGPEVRGALDGAQRPAPQTDLRNGLEIDLASQVIKVIENGRVLWTLHTSTGTGERYTQPDGDRAIAVTPTGEYVIERRIDGWRESDLGRLYRPAYFVGGIAIHGYQHVPPQPASHGCTRVTMEAMDFLWAQGFVDTGQPVVVY